jgi:hypothetical protein
MAIPDDAQPGIKVRWIGPPQEDVQPGDEGTFITFDGPPGDPEVVVSFPGALTFVIPKENVEPV